MFSNSSRAYSKPKIGSLANAQGRHQAQVATHIEHHQRKLSEHTKHHTQVLDHHLLVDPYNKQKAPGKKARGEQFALLSKFSQSELNQQVIKRK